MIRPPCLDRIPRAAGVLTAAILLLSACGDEPAEHPSAIAVEAPPVTVQTAVAAVAPITEPRIASGGVEPLRRVAPGTKLLGRVTEVPVAEGDRVHRGQLLAQLEDRDLRAAVAQAEAGLEMASAGLANATAQHRRFVALKERGSVTEKNLEDAVAAHRVAQAAVAQAEANLEAARVELGYARIASPIDGWVVARTIEAGDMAGPGRALFVVEDLSMVKIAVEVAEEIVSKLQRGDRATVTIGALPGELPAEVHRIVPAGDPASRTFTVQLLLDNPDARIKSGMFARARFAGAPGEALLVPAAALVRRGQMEGLYVVDEGRARLRWVRSGRLFDGRVEILSGLEPGERYVAEAPAAALPDGARVEEVD